MESGSNTNRRNWLLGGGLILLGALFLLWQVIPAPIIGALIPIAALSGIGVTFLAVYVNDRTHWWALIPAYVMFAVAGIIILSSIFHSGVLVASYVMFAIALPFLYVFVRNRENWWALIPASIMGLVGVALMIGAAARFIVPAIPVLMILFGIFLLMRTNGNRKLLNMPTTERKESPIIEFEPIRPMAAEREADKPRK
jgi:hypothetical protein